MSGEGGGGNHGGETLEKKELYAYTTVYLHKLQKVKHFQQESYNTIHPLSLY